MPYHKIWVFKQFFTSFRAENCDLVESIESAEILNMAGSNVFLWSKNLDFYRWDHPSQKPIDAL